MRTILRKLGYVQSDKRKEGGDEGKDFDDSQGRKWEDPRRPRKLDEFAKRQKDRDDFFLHTTTNSNTGSLRVGRR